MDLIQGKVAGLNVVRSNGNNPNSGADIQLRGIVTFTGDQSPLIIIDGIPGGNLDLLQQNDIASIDVLKDGSAAAIYGTRANAGVIIITTKKGKAGDPTFEYNTYFQREFLAKKLDYLNANEYLEAIKNYDNGRYDSPANKGGANTDLFEELLDKSNLSQYHTLAASGGTNKANYRASIFYNEANGIAVQNGRKQFGGRLNFNQSGLKDMLKMQVNVATNFNKANMLGGDNGFFEQAIYRNPTLPIYKEDGSFNYPQGFGEYNPLSNLAHRIKERDQQTFSGDARMTLNPLEGLNIAVFGSYVRDFYNDREFRSSKDYDQRPASDYRGMSWARKYNYLNWVKTLEGTIDYNKTIDQHSFAGLAGYSYQYGTWEEYAASNNGFSSDAYMDWNLGGGTAINNTKLPRPGLGSRKEDNTLIAFFGRLNYAFANRYFLQASLRREGSSRFGENNKWGNFPAISAGWTISKEDFMENVEFVNNLKLRAGFGVTGNQGIPNYRSQPILGTGGVYPQIPNGSNYQDAAVFEQTYGIARNPNQNLKWERKEEYNIGVDYTIWKNRISGAIDFFNRETKDLLYTYNVAQPPFVHGDMLINVGTIRSRGLEFTISANPVRTDDFSWDIDLAANTQMNKVVKLSAANFKLNYFDRGDFPSTGNLGRAFRVEEGSKIGNFYGRRFAGFSENGKWLFYNKDGKAVLADETSDADKAVIGNGLPKFSASISNTLRYKDFDLTLFFRGKFGQKILNVKDIFLGNKVSLPRNVLKSALDKHAQLNDGVRYSDYYLESGSFVKLDNLTLGYNVPFKTDYIKNLRVYLTGRNIATFTKYSGLDPEIKDTGFDAGMDGIGFYPRTKSWTIGLNCTF